ncbi:MAG: Na+ symporter family protein [crAssphage sp. isolate ctcc615]|uniref:Na+ symporter family protein n=1 Tax=crAssphage sp. isolate ctcc615 TaxID=2989853 RepID=A0A345BNX1_9CAUD|nr:MAG: Na+ symporter family protein [crAssphage sp. isolate ctcc615]AXF52142.1 MAG: Na+ symporter family protein [crAssphage sp. isolate ctcc615]
MNSISTIHSLKLLLIIRLNAKKTICKSIYFTNSKITQLNISYVIYNSSMVEYSCFCICRPRITIFLTFCYRFLDNSNCSTR